jgi:hypothetical protein
LHERQAGCSNWLVVGTGAGVCLVHLAQPGVSWLPGCMMTGSLYGWIRTLTARHTAAVAHAVYNLTLYGVASVIGNASP